MSKINSNEVKRFFKDILKLKVRVSTVACKNPFVQVSLIPVDTGDPWKLEYTDAIPAEFGQRLLDVIYGGKTDNIRFPAGNVQTNRCSMDARQWNEMKTLYAYTPPAK